jgi:hypothetical protein
MTKQTATILMRWVIFMALFGMVIYQSNQIDKLKRQLVSADTLSIRLLQDLDEFDQQYLALAKSCLK